MKFFAFKLYRYTAYSILCALGFCAFITGIFFLRRPSTLFIIDNPALDVSMQKKLNELVNENKHIVGNLSILFKHIHAEIPALKYLKVVHIPYHRGVLSYALWPAQGKICTPSLAYVITPTRLIPASHFSSSTLEKIPALATHQSFEELSKEFKELHYFIHQFLPLLKTFDIFWHSKTHIDIPITAHITLITDYQTGYTSKQQTLVDGIMQCIAQKKNWDKSRWYIDIRYKDQLLLSKGDYIRGNNEGKRK